MKTEQPDTKRIADGYEGELRVVFGLRAGELPRFDCILLGMGADGHTASLFPGSSALEERKRLVAANWVKRFNQYRMTMTVPVLTNADLVIFMVSGEEKADTLRAVLEMDEQPARLPSQLIKPNHGRLLWLVDRAAAGKLSFKED
jgi:6-phosphogluconolactonase